MNFKAQISFGESETGRGALIKLRSIADHHREKKPPINFNYTRAWGDEARAQSDKRQRCSWKRDKKSQLWHREWGGGLSALTICIFTPFGQQMRCEDAEHNNNNS